MSKKAKKTIQDRAPYCLICDTHHFGVKHDKLGLRRVQKGNATGPRK